MSRYVYIVYYHYVSGVDFEGVFTSKKAAQKLLDSDDDYRIARVRVKS